MLPDTAHDKLQVVDGIRGPATLGRLPKSATVLFVQSGPTTKGLKPSVDSCLRMFPAQRKLTSSRSRSNVRLAPYRRTLERPHVDVSQPCIAAAAAGDVGSGG